ncbi:WD40-repeat-containing domain protein, partial [Stachybotrys elegans]
TLEGHSDWVRSVVFSSDAKHLASASDDHTVRLWDATTGQCLQTLKGHSDWVSSVVFSPDAKHLASASDDHTVRLWDAATGQCLQIFNALATSRLSFTPDGYGLGEDRCWITWDGNKTLWLPVNFRPVSKHSFAISESRVVIGSASGGVTFFCIRVT